MKITPGGWDRNIKPVTKYPIVFAGRNTHIAQIITRGIPIEQAEANCNLIAAAPDLLEAAKLMLEFYNDLSASNPGFMGKLALQDYGRWNDAINKLPNAINRAEGKI